MPPASGRPSRRLIVLGSTGSIGVNTLAVVEHLHSRGLHRFEVVGLAARGNVQTLAEQAKRFGVKHLAVADQASDARFGDVTVFRGAEAALELIEAVAKPGDLVVGAIVGSAGLPATLAAIDRGCDIALANKETLVAAGALVMPKVRERGVNLLPVDSEHSAIFQCLVGSAEPAPETPAETCTQALLERATASIRRVVLTASGGPFRTWSRARTETASVDEALNHPTWNMGPKVTIDSASLMNKALEIIEAHWLFGLPANKIEAVIHPQSLIHSFVEFIDGSTLAQLGPPDMRTPIQYALTWPRRLEGCSKMLDWSSLRQMDFEPVDHERFPAVRLAYQVIEQGGTAGAVFNAANECAVAAFLDRQTSFGRISEIVTEALQTIPTREVHTLADIVEADQSTRRFVRSALGNRAAGARAAATSLTPRS